MNLQDLEAISDHIQSKKITFKSLMHQALDGGTEIFYVIPEMTFVTFHYTEPWRGPVKNESYVQDFEIGDTILLSEHVIKELWITGKTSLSQVLNSDSPAGFEVINFPNEDDFAITAEDLYLRKGVMAATNDQKQTIQQPSTTALKVIGLLMHHLAKSPKYASGSSPNKSQIKELLLELDNELDINHSGLSKVDERLLAEAMKYLETQKN